MVRRLLIFLMGFLSIPVWAEQDWSRWRLEDHIDPIKISLVGRYASTEDIRSLLLPKARGEAITIDTYNKEACERAREMLDQQTDLPDSALTNLCQKTDRRYVSIVRMNTEPFGQKKVIDFELQPEKTMHDQMEVFTFLGAGMMGLIASLPQEVSNWDDEVFQDPLKKWRSNVSNPPVIDGDAWAINFIGHPYSGAAYYVVARQTGFGQMSSFGFSVMMSTFYWEYGLEALAEKPSIQDLVLTPTIGSLIGEQLFQLNQKIAGNQGVLLGSKSLGTFGLIVSDPVGALVRGVNKVGNNQWVNSGKLAWASFPVYDERGSMVDMGVGLQIKLRFGKRQ